MSLFIALTLAQATTAIAPAATAQPLTPPEELRIVCKTIQGTGSRLNTQRLCMPKREWQRMWDNSAETMDGLQNHQYKRDPMSGR